MNHYDALEVSPRASQEVIRAAYRSLMQRFHPDRNPGDQAAAARAATVASAYEVLSDVQKRASYDADLAAAGRPGMPAPPADRGPSPRQARPVQVDPAQRGAGGRGRGQRARSELGLWLLAALVTLGGVFLARSLTSRGDPAAELDTIRVAMSSDSTAEAEKRRLYARKLAIIEEHPELMRRASAQRSDDMAARTFALLVTPLVVRVNQPAALAGPPLELTIPKVSLVVGSFDAPNLLAHMARHRERLVRDLATALAREAREMPSRSQADAHIRRVVAQAVTASLGIPGSGEYPSTYFTSPGTYGVDAVLLPDGFRLVQLGPSQ